MKNQYTLKSTINNDHKTICQDNQKVIFEKIDSIFAKIIYKNVILDNDSNKNNGLFASHVKGLNILSKKSLFIDYSNDEAIKKYNQKANMQTKVNINEVVLQMQQQNAKTLSKHLNAKTKSKIDEKFNNHNIFNALQKNNSSNKSFFDSNLIDLKNIIAPLNINKQDNEIQKDKTNNDKKAILVLVNPYKLRNYSFVIPEYLTLILNITKTSKILVYCPLDLNSPLESSEINYLFPIIFNTEVKLAAQIPLSIMDYPDFNKQKLLDLLIK